MILIFMNNLYIKAYTDNYIWLIRTNEDNILIDLGISLQPQDYLLKVSKGFQHPKP